MNEQHDSPTITTNYIYLMTDIKNTIKTTDALDSMNETSG